VTPPEITERHINYVSAIAYDLSLTPVGALAGRDELVSEALLVLWEAALEWDPSHGVPFVAYLAINVKRGLIDWLRHTYGRFEEDRRNLRLSNAMTQLSYEAMVDELGYDRPDPSPLPDHAALARAEFADVVRCILDECTDREREALLWPLSEDTSQAFQAKWGVTAGTAAAHRSHAKARVSQVRH
jgi:DNA-directed RNA polymerase specialized sigma24 family protein